MDRRTFMGSVAGGLVIARSAAQAQPAAKIPRVGNLYTGDPGIHLGSAIH